MTDTRTPHATDDRRLGIRLVAEFPAPPQAVFRQWTEADALARWFAPPGYSTLDAASDARPGGTWRLEYASDAGTHRYVEHGEFRVVDTDERLVFTLTQVDGVNANPQTLVTVEFESIGTSQSPVTRVHLQQTGYRSAALRDDNEQGWRGCLEALGRSLESDATQPASASGQEPTEADRLEALRQLFREWFLAAERKDLDAQMAPIAADVLSYEHNAPQQYRGVDALRAVCAAGLEYQSGHFEWDIPDLQIHIAGDTAITWGLNRMRNTAVDGAVREEWSRGTRIFQWRDGRWQMIHQHVSFPVGADGRAVTDR